ncbi:MAG: TspO/MBR family protein [Anaerolineae bacterium]
MQRSRVLPWVNVAITIATIVVNVLANALPLNGLNTGEISDRFDIYFVPAGYVFSIWGLIYLALIAFAIYQVLPSQRDNPHVRRIGWLYALSGVGNIAWIFFWHYERFRLTVPAMLVILGSLIAIFLALWRGRDRLSTADRWAILVPFSIYLGWISVATVANVTQLLYFLGWGGWGLSPELWAIVMLIVAAAIAVAMAVRHGSVAYNGVFVWAYIGIAIKHWGTPVVGITAAVLTGVIAVALLYAALRHHRLWSTA